MADCIFCKIAKNEIPSETIFEDSDVKVFKDIKPSAPIHFLFIPKKHIQSIAHLEVDHNEIISKLIYTAKNVAKDKDLTGYKLVFNVGREGGQVIDHLHLHLLGGWEREENPDKFKV